MWAAAPEKRRSATREATVHLDGTLNEIAVSERLAWQGDYADESFVLVSAAFAFRQLAGLPQPSLRFGRIALCQMGRDSL